MSTQIDVKNDEFTLQVPDWFDTNEKYQLVRPGGALYKIYYDTTDGHEGWKFQCTGHMSSVESEQDY